MERLWRLTEAVVASLIGTAILLALGEGLARWRVIPAGAVPTAANCLQRSVSLGLSFRPRCQATWDHGQQVGRTDQTTFHTNSLGLRDDEIENTGAVRILSLGDSCTWGWAVEQEQAYPQVLQRLLNPQPGTARVRVINAGRPGYTSYQGLVLLRELEPQIRPDVLIISYWFNDAQRDGDVREALRWQQRFFYIGIPVNDFLFGHSHLWRWAWNLAHDARGSQRTNREPRVSATMFQDNLNQMIALGRRHGARTLLLSFIGSALNDPYARAFAEVAKKQGVPLVAYDGPRLDVVHPTAEGYARLARVLRDRLEQAGYLTAVPDTPIRAAF
jgi:lysophospholipase L1-like esterase